MRCPERRTHHKIGCFFATSFGSRGEYHLWGKRYLTDAGLLGRDDEGGRQHTALRRLSIPASGPPEQAKIDVPATKTRAPASKAKGTSLL